MVHRLPKNASNKLKAYTLIKEAIINRRYAPGQFLSENELAEDLEISRTPIREALQTLEVEGFLSLVPNRGAQVASISSKDVEEIFELRMLCEQLAAAKLVANNNPIYMSQMRKFLLQQETNRVEKDIVGFVTNDREFHFALV